MQAVRAAWLRGGTSKGLFFRAGDLPGAGAARDALVLAAIGSPDPSGLQLNGVGGGISSTSKVAIVSPSERPGYDVDYVFGQVEVNDRRVNWEGSCGNLAAGVGLFALSEGLVAPAQAPGPQPIRVWQANQGYGMIVHVPPGVGAPVPPSAPAAAAAGVALLDLAGVAGREPAVYVELLEPTGERPLLPTGRASETLQGPDGAPIEASLVAAGNPTVFVWAAAAGLSGAELPSEMDYATVLPLVDCLRAQAAPLFGITEPSDQPRVAFVAAPAAFTTTAGDVVAADNMHLLSRISTPGRIHHAYTGTGSIALACASLAEGTVPWQCLSEGARAVVGGGAPLRLGHPGGIMEVRADVRHEDGVGWRPIGAGFERTARYLMRGEVFVPTAERAP